VPEEADPAVCPPPRSPELNGCVERAHRTHTEEFYEVVQSSFNIAELREQLLQWERIYNTVRPHQSLGYLTPSNSGATETGPEKGGRVSLII